MFKRMLVLGPAALLAAACSIDRPHPTDAASATVAFSAVKFWEAGATVSWNQLATDLATAAPAPKRLPTIEPGTGQPSSCTAIHAPRRSVGRAITAPAAWPDSR